MAALRIEESKPDIGSGKSLLNAISRAPLSQKIEKREIHREVRRGGRRSKVVVPAVNASSMSYTEESSYLSTSGRLPTWYLIYRGSTTRETYPYPGCGQMVNRRSEELDIHRRICAG